MFVQQTILKRIGLLFVGLGLVLSCRTVTLVQRDIVRAPTGASERQINTATQSGSVTATPPKIAYLVVSPEPPPSTPATAVPAPQSPTARAIVRVSTKAPTRIPPTPAPSFKYHVVFTWCGPNWQTFIEGTVIQDGVYGNGLLVRVSLDRDGSPIMDDYVTGTDATKPGGYTQIIDANAPHEGLWYVWVVDPQTHQRVSDIAAVKSDSKRVEETSCQSATVNFSN